jgi:hypothetical protein
MFPFINNPSWKDLKISRFLTEISALVYALESEEALGFIALTENICFY